MRDPITPTHRAISADSGRHWTAEGAWQVAPGIHRIPLPLPMDGLRAVNVYLIETDSGLILIDGGWAIPEARKLLERCLRLLDYGFSDINRFLVTHMHRDHFTLASVLGREYGAEVALGEPERPALELLLNTATSRNPFHDALVAAGAQDVAGAWLAARQGEMPDTSIWALPDTWLEGDLSLDLGTRVLDAVHTPGHTPGHYVYAEQAAGLLFAGDHVLPTITPSIGFTAPPADEPLGDFLSSLAKVRALPDLQLLPAHGPIAPSTHTRVDQLLIHHEHRLELSLAALVHGPTTARGVAAHLGWTRHQHPWDELDSFNQGLATLETKAHLDLLVARGQVTATPAPDGVVYSATLADPTRAPIPSDGSPGSSGSFRPGNFSERHQG